MIQRRKENGFNWKLPKIKCHAKSCSINEDFVVAMRPERCICVGSWIQLTLDIHKVQSCVVSFHLCPTSPFTAASNLPRPKHTSTSWFLTESGIGLWLCVLDPLISTANLSRAVKRQQGGAASARVTGDSPRSFHTSDPEVSRPLPWAPPNIWPGVVSAQNLSAPSHAGLLPSAPSSTSGSPPLWPPLCWVGELPGPGDPSLRSRLCQRAETGLQAHKQWSVTILFKNSNTADQPLPQASS